MLPPARSAVSRVRSNDSTSLGGKTVRKILAALALVATAACRTAAPGSVGRGGATGADTGGPDAPGAVERFLTAARSGDIRTMGQVFGTSNGAISGRDAAADVEKRMRALQCYLMHDGSRVVGTQLGSGSSQILTVELKQRELTRQARFTAVAGPQRRWYVESFDINALTEFCRP
jgi:hypothetical protein